MSTQNYECLLQTLSLHHLRQISGHNTHSVSIRWINERAQIVLKLNVCMLLAPQKHYEFIIYLKFIVYLKQHGEN